MNAAATGGLTPGQQRLLRSLAATGSRGPLSARERPSRDGLIERGLAYVGGDGRTYITEAGRNHAARLRGK